MASLYLNPELEPVDAELGARVSVSGDEARHAVTVARVRLGERIAIGDGSGFVVWGAVVAASASELAIEVDEVRHDPEPEPQLWLAQALAKGDRDELAIQAATELGAAGVIPWAAERSVSRWEGAKAAKGRERWASIVREASKQAIRSRVPDVAALASTADLAALPGRLLVLDPLGDVALSELELDGERITLVVGPEGGIAPREFDAMETGGALRVRLGSEVLRTSTAGPAALAVLNARLGRW
jgi:16S rRNA (uracil1498-N3)-methyltransferase